MFNNNNKKYMAILKLVVKNVLNESDLEFMVYVLNFYYLYKSSAFRRRFRLQNIMTIN